MELTPVAQFESSVEAGEAMALLRSHGISAIFVESELLVPEHYASRATQLLAVDATIPQPGLGPLVCPECGSFEVRTVPPYAHMFAALVAACIFFTLWTRSALIGSFTLVLLVAGWPVWLWLARISGKQKCRRCGWMFSE